MAVMVKFNKKKLPKEVVAHWPEVFSDLDVQTIPIQYLIGIKVMFKDGKNWYIRLKPSRKNFTHADLENTLQDIFRTYAGAIKNVDFSLDTQKIKKDIQKRTHKFIKKNK